MFGTLGGRPRHAYPPLIGAVVCAPAITSIASGSPSEGCTMKLQIFSAKSGNRKPEFENLEASVNEWLADHPNVVIENVNDLSQPNMSWSQHAAAVWYTDQ